MNAYELADKLQELDVKLHLIVLFKSAEMLRQQADRIAELEKEKEELKSSPFDGADDSTNVSKNSITQPYAYAVVQGEDGKENVSLQFDHPEMCGQKYKQAIPLFTTPQTKPLSDEEIKQIYEKIYEEGHDNQVLALARAIEERHGIK